MTDLTAHLDAVRVGSALGRSVGALNHRDRGVLLCQRCHDDVHHRGWEINLGSDNHPWLVPPATRVSARTRDSSGKAPRPRPTKPARGSQSAALNRRG